MTNAVDETAQRHYVLPATEPPGRIPALRLLILISALITGLTGLIAGQPAVAREGAPSAIAAVFVGRVEASGEVAQADRHPEATDRIEVWRRHGVLPLSVLVPQAHKVDERRIE